MIFGYELIIDLKGCENVTGNMIEGYFVQLCKLIKMKRFGEPLIEYFGKDHLQGWTGIQLITTSSITAHFTDDAGYINIFSCKNFNKQKALSFTKKFFKASIKDFKVLKRGDING